MVPGSREELEPAQLCLVFVAKAKPGIAVEVEAKRSSRHLWVWLLRRVFTVDVLTCERGPDELGQDRQRTRREPP